MLQRNALAAAIWLVLTMFALAGMFLILDAPFIAAIQVLVYAGAIMVLFLFVIMLLNLGDAAERHPRGRARKAVGARPGGGDRRVPAPAGRIRSRPARASS